MALAGLILLILIVAAVARGKAAEGDPGTRADAQPNPDEAYAQELEREGDDRRAAVDAYLASPEAQAERQRSQTAYEESSAAESIDLLASKFAGQLDGGEAALPDSRDVVRYIGDTGAVLDPPDGPPSLATSTVPLRAPLADGTLAPVDLELRSTEGALAPANPDVAVELPARAGDPLRFPGTGVSVDLAPGAPEASATVVEDLNSAHYADVGHAVDLVVQPTLTGAESFELIRSAASPQQFTYHFNLPPGATLEAAPFGGARVVAGDGAGIMAVKPPTAIDAQGRPLEVTSSVRGDDLVFGLDPEQGEIAFPALLDPAYELYPWSSGYPAGLGNWIEDRLNNNAASLQQSCLWAYFPCYSNPSNPAADYGLYIYDPPPSPYYYQGGEHAGWSYYVPRFAEDYYSSSSHPVPSTYISLMVLAAENYAPTAYQTNGNADYFLRSPFPLAGIWAPIGGYVGSTYYPAQYTGLKAYDTSYFGFSNQSAWIPPDPINTPYRSPGVLGKQANIQLYSYPSENTTPTGWRTYEVGAVTLELTDPEDPTVTGVTHPVLPIDAAETASSGVTTSEWVDSITAQVSVDALDEGLGVKQFDLSMPSTTQSGGVAHVIQNVNNPGTSTACTGLNSSYCPRTQTGGIDYGTADMPEGVNAVQVAVKDPTDRPTSTASWRVRVDRSAPSVTASGPLVDSADPQTGARPSADIESDDALSGVVSATLVIKDSSGNVISGAGDSVTQDCASSGCSLDASLVGNLVDEDPGTYHYILTVTDAAGNSDVTQDDFQMDPYAPELTLSGPLTTVLGPVGATLTDLDIDVAESETGDTGVSRIDVEVDGVNAQTDSGFCTSTCPATRSDTFTYDDQDWGPEVHVVEVIAYDQAGNATSDEIEVNAPENVDDPICPSVTPTGLTGGTTLTGPQALAAAPPHSTDPSDDGYYDAESDSYLAPAFRRDDDAAVGDTYYATDGLAYGFAEPEAVGAFGIEHEICLAPLQQSTAAEPAEPAVHEVEAADGDTPYELTDALVYANAAPDADSIVRSTPLGVASVLHFRGSAAPTSLSWKLGVEEGLEIDTLTDGSVALVDPEEDAPGDLVVPDPPDPPTDPIDALTNVETQLEEGRYELAEAMDETGLLVYAVLPLPKVIDALGAVSEGTYTVSGGDTLTVSVPTGTSNIVMPVFDAPRYNFQPPPIVQARYLSFWGTNEVEPLAMDLGCKFGQDAGGARIRTLIADMGAVQKAGGVFGVQTYAGNGFVPNRPTAGYPLSVRTLLGYVVDGRNQPGCGDAYPRMRLAYGLSNDKIDEPDRLNGSTTDALKAGLDARRTVFAVRNTFPAVRFVVGTDIEPGFGTQAPSLKLAQGASYSGDGWQIRDISYGAVGACSLASMECKTGKPCPPPPNEPNCVPPLPAWSINSVAAVNQGFDGPNYRNRIFVLPQIYHRDAENNWARVAEAWNNESSQKFVFDGVTAENRENHGAEHDPEEKNFCTRVYKPVSAWRALQSQLRRSQLRQARRELVLFPCASLLNARLHGTAGP